MNVKFNLDARLLENSFVLADLELSRVILKNDKDNIWFVLVPRKNNLVEIIDLSSEDQQLLTEEVALVSEFLKEYYRPYKINIANLGNVVRQLHVHVIARNEGDRAWPNPIWNTPVENFFEMEEIENIKSNFLDFIN